MKIPLIKPDLPEFTAIERYFREALESGRLTNFGNHMAQFEREVSHYLQVETVTVSSGTLGLVLTLQALGLQRGQKVVVPSFTFMATAQAVLYAGGIPVFAEIEDDLTISLSDLEKTFNQHKDISVVLPVHVFGLPCRVKEIQEIVDRAAKKHEKPIRLLYDASHAFGATRDGVKVGNFGDAEVFSLSVTKALSAVEGGLVASHDPKLIKQIRTMRNYGMEAYTYNATLPGLNGKMSEFHAIIGIENLKRIETILEMRKKNAEYFFKQIEEKTPFKSLRPPAGVRHTFKDFTVIVPKDYKLERERIMAFLKEKGIDTRAYFYPPVHEQDFFKRFQDRPLPQTEDLSRRVITLPFFTEITEKEMDYIADCLALAIKVHA